MKYEITKQQIMNCFFFFFFFRNSLFQTPFSIVLLWNSWMNECKQYISIFLVSLQVYKPGKFEVFLERILLSNSSVTLASEMCPQTKPAIARGD